MKPEEFDRARELFLEALDLAPTARQEFLRQRCGEQDELRREVESLLACEEPSRDFLTGSVSSGPAAELDPSTFPGYRIERVLGQGGMSVVYLATRQESGEQVALKVLQPGSVDARTVRRLEFEAEILSRLDHPGVARLLDAGGVDTPSGPRPFFVMEYVEGLPLTRFAADNRLDSHGILELWERVCQAVEYAHQHGVIHRDLKPANILVTAAGQPRILDFGVARAVESDPAEATLLTRTGEMVGTLAYMSPEQVRAAPGQLDTRADVYALGVIGYELLAGERPHRLSGLPVTEAARIITEQDPSRLGRIDARLAGDIETIVARALERERERRYSSAAELAADIRRHLRGDPITARPPTSADLLHRWVRANRVLAGLILAVLLSLLVGSAGVTWMYLRAERNAREARDKTEQILRLSAFRKVEELRDAADRIWPAWPSQITALEEWIAEAEALRSQLDTIDGKPGLLAQVEALRGRARQATDGSWRFDQEADAWWHDQLTLLVQEIRVVTDRESGLLSAEAGGDFGWGIRRRLDEARTIGSRSIEGEQWRAAWAEANEAIRDHSEYDGLDLSAQMGLVPLGPDPDTGLWEFWHVQTGERPERDERGRLSITANSGLVLVLLPGASFAMGAQWTEVDGLNHDAAATENETPVHEVDLDPFFLSKYEMTQGQWLRATGTNPSFYAPGYTSGVEAHDASHPVEQVSWIDCDRVLKRFGLMIPTEAQWEFGCRAGTEGRWWCGEDVAALAGNVNIADQSVRGRVPWRYEDELSDGFIVHSPVGSFGANDFGLHDTLGNVVEWCADHFGDYELDVEAGTGLRQVDDDPLHLRPARGGGFSDIALVARASARYPFGADTPFNNLGIRPAALIQR